MAEAALSDPRGTLSGGGDLTLNPVENVLRPGHPLASEGQLQLDLDLLLHGASNGAGWSPPGNSGGTATTVGVARGI